MPSGLTPDAAVVAVAFDVSVDRDWGAEVTLGLAEALSASGRDVLVLDLDLDTPRLHQAAGVENREGVSDAMLYGISIRKIAQPIRKGEFLLVSAGTVVGDSRRVLESDEWIAMLGGVREAGAVALLHMPADAQGAASILERADAVVLVGPPSMQMDGVRVVARLGSAEAQVEVAASPGGSVEGVDIDALAPAVETELDDREPEYASAEAMEVADPTDISRPAPEEPEDSEAGSDTFSLDDLPDSEAGAGQAADESDTFSLSGVEGSQYDASGATDAPPVEDLAPAEEAPPAAETASMGGPPEPAVPTPPEEPEEAGIQRLEVEDSMIVDEGELDELADSAPMMEGLETGSGFSMGGPPEPVEASPAAPEEAPAHEATASAEEAGAPPPPPEPPAEEPVVEVPAQEADPAAPAEEASAADESVAAEEETASSQETPTVVTDAGAGELRVQDEPRLAGLEKLEKQQKQSARARVAALLVFALVVLGGFGWTLAFTGILQVPGITPQERLGSGVLPPVELPGPQPTTPELSHSLMMDTHRELETPRALIDVLTERVPGVLFFVAPVMEGDRQLFALYAAAYGAAEADALRETIGEVRDRLDSAEWRVLPTSYAFFIEEQGEAAVASETAAALMDLGVPTYVLQVDYPDGSAGYRVYAGAHVDENDAGPMVRLLRANGISDAQLTSRRGKLPE